MQRSQVVQSSQVVIVLMSVEISPHVEELQVSHLFWINLIKCKG